MRSVLDEMSEVPEFPKFLAHMENTANYFVAHQRDQQREHALKLCTAEAFKAGMLVSRHSTPEDAK